MVISGDIRRDNYNNEGVKEMIKLKLTESKNIHLKFNNDSKDISEEDYDKFYDLSANGIVIQPKNEVVPFAWDPVLEIKGKDLEIRGDFGQQGSHSGKVVITLPLDKVSNYYDVYIESKYGTEDEIVDILGKYNLI